MNSDLDKPECAKSPLRDLSDLPDAENGPDEPRTEPPKPAGGEDLTHLPDANPPNESESSKRSEGSLPGRRSWGLGAVSITIAVVGLSTVYVVREVYWRMRMCFEESLAYGLLITGLLTLLLVPICLVVVRELRAYFRLASVRRLRESYGELAGKSPDADLDRRVRKEVERLLSYWERIGEGEFLVSIQRLRERINVANDAAEWREDMERILLIPLDEQAHRAIEEEAANVGIGTATSPYGFMDAVISLWRNVRLIRRIAAIYKMRAGGYGTFLIVQRTLRAVAFANLTQETSTAVLGAAGSLKFLIGPLAQGVTNAAMTIRVGLISIKECRPLSLPEEKERGMVDTLRKTIFGAIRASFGWSKKDKDPYRND